MLFVGIANWIFVYNLVPIAEWRIAAPVLEI